MARMSWSEACQLDRTLLSLAPFFNRPPDYAQTLTGGLTNRCWKLVTIDAKAYVWRPNSQITKAFSISRFQEQQILSAIKASQLAPEPIYINDQGLLVTWIEGESLHTSLDFDALLHTMIAIHSMEIQRLPVAPFNFTARVDHYWMLLEAKYKNPANSALYQQWRLTPNLADVGFTLCHFDLAGYNMVKTRQGNKVIDWEYATIADPRLDLTLSILASGGAITDDKIPAAVERYCQLRGVESLEMWQEGVMAWQPRAKMMAMLWNLLAHQLWGDAQYLTQAQQLQQTICS